MPGNFAGLRVEVLHHSEECGVHIMLLHLLLNGTYGRSEMSVGMGGN